MIRTKFKVTKIDCDMHAVPSHLVSSKRTDEPNVRAKMWHIHLEPERYDDPDLKYAWPSDAITLITIKQSIADQFDLDSEFYVDFTPVK